MKSLVIVKGNDLFTDSLVISSGTGVGHRYIKEQIRKHKDRIQRFGLLVAHATESTGGRPEELFRLNEQQATFLVTLLKNTDDVVDFKFRLTQEFYRMRCFIAERSTADWQQSRLTGKQTRRDETDMILTKLIPHAERQGSRNAGKLYMTYSKLVNSILGIEAGQRDKLSLIYVDTIKFLERAIENIISLEVDKGTHYKEIYQICKAKCQLIKELSFLPQLDMIA